MPGKNTYDNVIREVLMSVSPKTARVPPDKVSDSPFALPGPIDVGDETDSPVEPQRTPYSIYDREVDRRASGEGSDDIKAMLDAIERRQKLGRGE